MSQMRQRKRTANADDDDSPPDLLECASSSHEDGGAPRNGRANDREEATAPPEEPAGPGGGALDGFLSTYGAFSGKTFTADQGLKVLQWSSWAVSYATRNDPRRADLSGGLNKLYSEISFTRYVLRFYGFFQSLEGYRSGSWAGGEWDNARIGKIAKYLMAGSMMIYYPLEHVAYAGWKMPGLARVDANKFSAVSCAFWTAYIVGDFWAGCLKWRELRRKLADVREALVRRKGEDDKGAMADLPEEERALVNGIRHIKLQVLRCLLFILPAVNWSLPNWATNPLLREWQVNGLMLAEAYTSVYQSLRAMNG